MRRVCLYHLWKREKNWVRITVEDVPPKEAPRIVGAVNLAIGPTVDKLIFHRWIDAKKAISLMRNAQADYIQLFYDEQIPNVTANMVPEELRVSGALFNVSGRMLIRILVEYYGVESGVSVWVNSYFDLGRFGDDDFSPCEVLPSVAIEQMHAHRTARSREEKEPCS